MERYDERTEQNAESRLAMKMLDNLYDQNVLAERKINALFGANTLLVAALALGGQVTLADLSESADILILLGVVVRVLLLTAVAFSTLSALFALVPRIKVRSKPSVFFFGTVASVEDADDFIAQFDATSEEERRRQLLDQVYVNSVIVTEKYKWIRRAAISLVVSLLMWILLQGINFVAV